MDCVRIHLHAWVVPDVFLNRTLNLKSACTFLIKGYENRILSIASGRHNKVLTSVLVPERFCRWRRKLDGSSCVPLAIVLPDINECDIALRAKIAPQVVRCFVRAKVSDEDRQLVPFGPLVDWFEVNSLTSETIVLGSTRSPRCWLNYEVVSDTMVGAVGGGTSRH